ncbi:hypothetical protein C1H46_029914 [Malus baccata]|uniref:Uncharacterized protein n=1 Tax=Malus baccata TaxID=106549 RepID=A0A540LDG1_MALBA|nr:hypothetical protein C1H46_029914 [Malus baccata]
MQGLGRKSCELTTIDVTLGQNEMRMLVGFDFLQCNPPRKKDPAELWGYHQKYMTKQNEQKFNDFSRTVVTYRLGALIFPPEMDDLKLSDQLCLTESGP